MRLGPDAQEPEANPMKAAEATAPEPSKPEVEKIVPTWLKTTSDVVGFVPVANIPAGIVSTAMSAVELTGQYVKGNKQGMKEAAIDLVADASAIALTRAGGLAVKAGGKVAIAAERFGPKAVVLTEKVVAGAAKVEGAAVKAGEIGQEFGLTREHMKQLGRSVLANQGVGEGGAMDSIKALAVSAAQRKL